MAMSPDKSVFPFIFSDQKSYEKCIPLLKKYAELVEPSKSELPQKMLSSLAAILHDTDDT